MERLPRFGLAAPRGPGLMDWQAQYVSGVTPWDEGGPHPALLDYMADGNAFEGRVLIPGCGAGNDLRAISTSSNHVVGLDIAPAAIEKARFFPRSGNEEYVVEDLFNLPADYLGAFDWIVEHTCFCAIDPSMRPAYVKAIAGALKHDAHLFAIFYLNPAAERQPPYGVKAEELDRAFSQAFEIVREWIPARTFEGRENRELVRLLRRR